MGADQPVVDPISAKHHVDALEWMLAWLDKHGLRFDSIGVRVVHGGGSPLEASIVDETLLARLRQTCELAPLQDRPTCEMLEHLRENYPSQPVVAVFDSAFHASMPEVARTYALPHALCERHGIRRLGFHGLALRSVIDKLRTSGPLPRRIVAAHLGGGASVTAIADGRSLDTSMGYTPLEGLVMARRSGDIDPALVTLLARAENCSAETIVELFQRASGLLGVSGASADMQEIERLRGRGDRRAALAFDLFVHSARKHIAAAMAVLNGADALVFSGGIGENSSTVRAAISSGMEWCGISLDEKRNAASPRNQRISSDDSAVAVYVIGVDEESPIARATLEQLAAAQ